MRTRVHVPDDLDAVTTSGAEVGDLAAASIWASVQDWYRTGLHPAIQVCVRVNGHVILDRAIGHSWGNAPTDPPDAEQVVVTPSTPFCVYSAAKGITTTVVHRLIEQGVLDLNAHVCDYLPWFTTEGKDRIRLRHVLTHTAGVPVFPPGIDFTRLHDHDYVIDCLERIKPLHRPGLFPIYHAVTFGVLTREIVAATTGRSIRELLRTEILDPLGFRWTNYGVEPDEVPLVAPSHPTGEELSGPLAAAFTRVIGGSMYTVIPHTNEPEFLTTVLPSSSTVSNAHELSRFYEMLRRGGELDGVRVLSPESVRAASSPHTRLLPNVAVGLRPMRWGMGFMVSSDRFGPFGRNSGGAFGHTGLVNIAAWADPSRRMSAAIVSSGKPGPTHERDLYNDVLDAITRSVPRVE
ncbi:MAG: beta-lactamase family protein [Nocardiaceae bacterium]|nr:beta-lactamase family protein [Nocardiaceae bacterium]